MRLLEERIGVADFDGSPSLITVAQYGFFSRSSARYSSSSGSRCTMCTSTSAPAAHHRLLIGELDGVRVHGHLARVRLSTIAV